MATTANLPPRFTNWRRAWVRLVWLGIAAVVVFAVLVFSNWAWNSKREEARPGARSQDAGVKFTPVVKAEPTVTMPVIKQQPPPEPSFQFAAAAKDLPGNTGKEAASRGSALFAYAAHTSAAEAPASAPSVIPGGGPHPETAADDPLAASLRATSTGKTAKGHILKNARLVIPQGTHIPCTLKDRIITQLPGFVRCETWQPVPGKHGDVMALPAHTLFFGQYSQGVNQGSDRLGVLWTNASTPDDIELPINSPAVDELGSAGVTGYIDNHVGSKLGALALYTLLEAGPAIAQTALQNNNRGNNSYNTTNITGPSQNVLGGWLQQKLQQPPTLIKNQGEAIDIIVAQNWDLSCCIKLELINDR